MAVRLKTLSNFSQILNPEIDKASDVVSRPALRITGSDRKAKKLLGYQVVGEL